MGHKGRIRGYEAVGTKGWGRIPEFESNVSEMYSQWYENFDDNSTQGKSRRGLIRSSSKDDDYLQGGKGRDKLRGGEGDDELLGGRGHDRLSGGKGDDELLGGSGRDRLSGGKGDDYLIGGDGNDYLKGGKGDDILIGGNSNDRLIGGAGGDTMRGGGGRDTFVIQRGGGYDIIDDFTNLDRIRVKGLSNNSINIVDEGNDALLYANSDLLARVVGGADMNIF